MGEVHGRDARIQFLCVSQSRAKAKQKNSSESQNLQTDLTGINTKCERTKHQTPAVMPDSSLG